MRSVDAATKLRWVVGALAVAMVVACADHTPDRPPTDIGGGVDARTADVFDATSTHDGSMDSTVAVDATTDVSDVGFDRPVVRIDAGTDSGGVTDNGLRLEVTVDPLAVPAPGSECTSDASVRAGDPTIDPPRPIVPQSVSRVTSQRPSFRWALPAGTTGARVEVCADRCCTRVIATLDADGTTVRPTTSLPPGVVYWRMFGRAGGATGSRASYTWEFEVRRRDTPIDSSWGTIRDFTGDGYDDLLIFASERNADDLRTMYVVEGGVNRRRVPRAVASLPEEASRDPNGRIGDFNGDGRADFVYLYRPIGQPAVIVLMQSNGRDGFRAYRLETAGTPSAYMTTPLVIDWNGDGYSDIVTSVSFVETGLRYWGSLLLIYRGSPAGIGPVPQESISFVSPIDRPSVYPIGEIGDLDLDGYGDAVFADQGYSGPEIRSFLVFGRPAGSPRVELFPDPLGESSTDDFYSPADFGDLDGDGRTDIATSAPVGGSVYVYQSSLGVAMPSMVLVEPVRPGESRGFGNGRQGGDFNGDGLADLLISAPGSYVDDGSGSSAIVNSGRLYIYRGGASGLARVPNVLVRMRIPGDSSSHVFFGESIAVPGDLDADGFDDMVISDPAASTICYVFGSSSLADEEVGVCESSPGYGTGVF